MRYFFLITLPFYVIDQITKIEVLRHIGEQEFIPVIPGFFNLVHVHNTGAAFGMLRDNNVFFVCISAAALALIIFFGKRDAFGTVWLKVAAALIAAGILGNVTDRLIHGHVVDFLDFVLPWYGHWPSFNIADSCIFVAAAIFLVSSFFDQRATGKA